MTVHVNGTSTARAGLRLDELHETVGLSALGRVLTFIITTKNVGGVRDVIAPAVGTARAHPCRIITVLLVDSEELKVDAELRVGPEADLSEIATLRCSNDSADNSEALVIPLLLPDVPVVVWWVQDTPENPSHIPIRTIAQHHITTTQNSGVPAGETLRRMHDGYASGDTGFAWMGTTS